MHIGRMVKVLNTAIERDLNRELAQFDLTGSQGAIMGYLTHHPGREICQKDLEREFELSHPTMSSILCRMESKGIIATAPLEKDKRYKKISLTEKGIALDREIFSRIEKMESRLLNGFSEDEIAEAFKLMHRLIQNISE